MLDKKYLIVNGCSFTEGHHFGNEGSWAKFLGDKLNLEVINLAKGGSGNDSITWKTIEFSETYRNIAKDSLYVIQLSECLRYQIYFDDFINNPMEWHVTPSSLSNEDSATSYYKDGSGAQRWIYKNRHEIVHIYSNITFALYKTLQNIISLVSYFESNGYPYIIFDGINDHKPFEYNGSYYLRESYRDNPNEEFKLKTTKDVDLNDFKQTYVDRWTGYFINENVVENIFSNKKIFKEIPTMMKFVIEIGLKNHNDGAYYFKENGGHPNIEAAEQWADVIKNYIEDIFGKSK